MHPEHAGQLPNTEHVVLPGGNWADLKLSLTHGEAQRIETAQLLADYDVKGEFAYARGLVRSALSGAPEEWRKTHEEPTLNVVDFALNSYEKANEASLASTEVRERMAAAQMNLIDVYGRIFTAAWSYPQPLTDWESVDMTAVRILRRRSQAIWNRLQKELGERLKDAEPSEQPADSTT